MVYNEIHAFLAKELGESYTYELKREKWGFIVTIVRADKKGTASLYWYYDNADKAYFAALSVSKEERLKGYGSALQTVCESLAKELGYKEILLSVYLIEGQENTLVDMYKKRGYIEVSTERTRLEADIAYKVWLSKSL